MPWSSLKKKDRNDCPPITQLTANPSVSLSIRRSGKDRPWPASCARFSIRSTPQQRSHARRFTNGNTVNFKVIPAVSREKIVGKIGYPLNSWQKSITRGFTQIDPYRLYMFIQVPTSIWSVPLEVLRQKPPKHRLTLGRRTKTSHQK